MVVPRFSWGPPLFVLDAASSPAAARPARCQIPGRREALPLGAGLLVAPRVLRAPEAPAAREARRPHFVRRRASKPARALRSLRRPPHLCGQAPQASRRPPIGRPSCSAMSHVIRLRVFQTLKSQRWNCNVLSGARKLTPGNYVRLLFWLTLWPRRTDNETPLDNDAVRGLVLTVIRRPSASSLPRRCTRRSPPR